MKRKIFILIYLMISFSLLGQKKLTLKDAIRIGIENNLDVRVQNYDVEISKKNNSWGQAGRYPNMSFNLNQNNRNTTNKPANAFPLPETNLNSLVTQPNLSIQWTIFNGQKVLFSKKRLEKLQEQNQTDVYLTTEGIIQSVTENYYQLVLENQKLNVFKKILELSRDRYEYARLQREIGTGGSYELLQQESNYLSDSISIINQKMTINNANRALNQVIGEKQVNKYYSLYEELKITTPKVYSLEELFEKTKEDNYTLKRERITQQISNYDIAIAKADVFPKIDINAGYNANITNNIGEITQFAENGFEIIKTTQKGHNHGPYINITLNMTLFDGGKLKRAMEIAKLIEIQNALKIEKVESDLYKQLSDALDLYNTRLQLFNLNNRNKEVALSNLELSRERLRIGTINSFDYRQIQNTYLNSALSELESIFNLIKSETELLKISGELLSTNQ